MAKLCLELNDYQKDVDASLYQATKLFASLPCEAIPEETGDHYARLKREAEKQGTPLDENDLWIAATAMALDAILVTADSDFQRIVGLRLEDWTKTL